MSDDGAQEPAIEPPLELQTAEYHKSGARISIDALCSYVPASIIRFLSDHASGGSPAMNPPWRHSYETVVLFADVSGFTDLSERLAMKGREGAEQLAKHLNSYFEQLVRVIASQGGDVFKFAGDALLVLWPPSEDDVSTVARRAVQSALEIQRKMHNAKLQEDVVLSVKLGIGVGECSIVHVGGVLSRMEYLATGSPLIQAFASEHKAVAGQVVCSPEAWAAIQDHFVASISPSGHAYVQKCTDRLRKVGIVKTANLDVVNDVRLIESISNYVPGAVLPFLNATEERWASELRHVAVIFANLGFTEEQLAKIASDDISTELDRVQQVIFSVQTAIYQYEGSVNKFLLDDKGSTLVAVFGLPPVAHEDDSNRAILASLVMSKQLTRLGFLPAIGITTGTAFCGVVGSRSRREYSVLGDVVNLSARLMQHAKTRGGGVLCDQTTQYSSRQGMAFEELPAINVKGKRDLVKVFKPIVSSVAPHGIWNQHKITSNGTVSPSAFQFVHSMHNPHAELSRTLKMPVANGNDQMAPPQVPTLSTLWDSFPPRACKINDVTDCPPVTTVDDLAWAESARNWLADEDEPPLPDIPHVTSIYSPTAGENELWGQKLDRPANPSTILAAANTTKPIVSRTLSGHDSSGTEANPQTPRNDPEYCIRHSDLGDHPYKAAKFLIQNRGYISIDCAKIQTVVQLKERLIDNLKKRMLISQAATPEQFAILLENNVQLQNEYVSLAALARAATPGPVLELILQRKPDDKTETGLSAAEILKIISHSVSSWSRSTFVLEGEAGYGKSRLLAQFVREAPAFALFRAANPLESKTPLGIWRELFMRLIDTEITNRGLGDLAQNRKTFVLKFVSSNPINAVLNEVLPLELDETEETLSMSPLERLSNCTTIMLNLLGVFAKQIGRMIIVIDDALLMDKLSWGFALRVSCDFNNIVLILGTRPVNKSNLGAFDLEVPNDYTELLNRPTTQRLLLRALGNDEIHQIALETLGVAKIPNTLGIILIQRSHGNPLVCKEILYALRKAALIDVRSDKSGKVCVLSDKFADLSAVPVPICLQNILGCRIDRLGHIHEIILKVASVIGNEFQMDLLTKTYPILEHGPRIPEVVNDLVNLNVFSIAHASVDISNGAGNIYQFVDGFMRDVALSRLLVSQKQLLLTRLNEVKTRANYFADLQIKGGIKQSGFLIIRKAEPTNSSAMRIRVSTSKWKKRWVTLHENALALFYHPTHSRVLGVIFLDGANVSMALPNVGREFTIQVQAQYWMKKGIASDTSRLFFLAAPNMDEARNWLLKIMNAIEKQFSVRERHAAEAAVVTEPNSHRNSEEAPISQNSDKMAVVVPRQTLRSSFASSVQLLRRLKSSASNGSGGSSVRRSLLSLKMNGRGQSLDLDPSQSVNSSISEIVVTRIPWRPTIQVDALLTTSDMKRRIVQWLIDGTSFQSLDDTTAEDNVVRPMATDNGVVKSGSVQVFDINGQQWQRRWVVITADSVIITTSQYEEEVIDAFHLPSSRFTRQDSDQILSVHAALALHGSNIVYDQPVVATIRIDDYVLYRDLADHLCKVQVEDGTKTKLKNTIEVLRGLVDDVQAGRIVYESVNDDLLMIRSLISNLMIPTSETETIDSPVITASLNSSPLNNDVNSSDWIMKMMDECEIDESTKTWLARCYTLTGQDLTDLRRDSNRDFDPPADRTVRALSDVSSLQSDLEMCSLEEDHTGSEVDVSSSVPLFIPPVDTPVQPSPLLSSILTWDFDIFAYEKPGLTALLLTLFDGLDLSSTLRIDRLVLNAFLEQVASSYLDNAYHNLFHAVDTTQTAACLLRTYGASSLVTPLESLALVIAAVCHDIGHPGLGNTYQINAGTRLALLYNDQAVLEQHHCAMTFHILKKPETNILAGLSPAEFRSVRKIIISSILSTDMNCHFALSEKFSNLLSRMGQIPSRPSSPRPSLTQLMFSQPDREIIVNMLLHAADISNQCKPWPTAKRWSDCILLEFYHQGDIERDAGLTISPNCDRNTTDRLQLALNFLDFVVAPLFVSLTQLLPDCIVACKSLRENRAQWDTMLFRNISNSNLPPDKKLEEEQRWRRRLQSFDDMIKEAETNVPIKNRKSSIQLFESFVRANSNVQSSASRSNSRSRQMQPITEHSQMPTTSISVANMVPFPSLELGPPPEPPSFTDAIAEEEDDEGDVLMQVVTPTVKTIPAAQRNTVVEPPSIPKRGSILSRFWGGGNSKDKRPKL